MQDYMTLPSENNNFYKVILLTQKHEMTFETLSNEWLRKRYDFDNFSMPF